MYNVEIDENEKRVTEEEVRAVMDRLLEHYSETGCFSISFVSDKEMEELNSTYRGIGSPTDILTFRLDDGEEWDITFGEEMEEADLEEKELGDIFISLDSMERNASEFSVPVEEELRRLLLHGLLHLRGLDHTTNDFSSEPMLLEQEETLRALF